MTPHPPPPGLRRPPARPPAAPREAGTEEGLAPAWGAGPGARGRDKRSLEGHGRRGAASGTQHDGCGEPGRAAPAAAALETRRLPGALRFGAARSLQTPWTACSRERTGARSPLPARDRAGISVRGTAWERAGGRWGSSSGLVRPLPRA